MLSSSTIADYIEQHKLLPNSESIRRTRASTRKFSEENKVEFKRIENKKNVKNLTYELNGRTHEIKIEQTGTEEIAGISCNECEGSSS